VPDTVDDAAKDDPDDRDVVDLAVEAIVALSAIDGPSRTDDRSRICRERRIPAWTFGYLGRKGFLRQVGGDLRDLADDLRERSTDPEGLQAYLAEVIGLHREGRRQRPSYVRAIERELRKWADESQLTVQPDRRAPVLALRQEWTNLLWPHLKHGAGSWIAPKDPLAASPEELAGLCCEPVRPTETRSGLGEGRLGCCASWGIGGRVRIPSRWTRSIE
jgi:hypothetical protein